MSSERWKNFKSPLRVLLFSPRANNFSFHYAICSLLLLLMLLLCVDDDSHRSQNERKAADDDKKKSCCARKNHQLICLLIFFLHLYFSSPFIRFVWSWWCSFHTTWTRSFAHFWFNSYTSRAESRNDVICVCNDYVARPRHNNIQLRSADECREVK